MTAINSLLQQYSLYIPQITWTDVIEIIIIAYVLYNVLIWIKDTRAWALLKGIIIVVALVMIAVLLNLNHPVDCRQGNKRRYYSNCNYIPARIATCA